MLQLAEKWLSEEYNDLKSGWYLVYYRIDIKRICFEKLEATDYESAEKKMKSAWAELLHKTKRSPALLFVPPTIQQIVDE